MLVRGGEVGPSGVELRLVQLANDVEERGLETREREVEAGDPRNREVEHRRVSLRGDAIDRRSARVAETEQTRSLVERLARCIVERGPQPLGSPALSAREEKRVPSAREQACEGRLERVRLQVERGDVALEVVDGD